MLDDLLGALKHGGFKRHGYEHHDRHDDHGHGHDRGRNDRYGHGNGHHAPMALAALRAIFANKVLLAALIVAFLVIAALGAWLLITLLSLSGPLLDSLSRAGVKGLLETVLSLARGVWEGTGGK